MTEYEALQRFHQMLTDTGETIIVYGFVFDSALVLRKLDPIAYKEMFNNWVDSEGIEIDD